VLGLGNLGAAAAMPVMEGKAALFKRFAGVDAWPVCLDTQDTEEIIRTVQILAPAYGGINLEDIAAPRCFEIEARLRELLDIPVFHDDQHGTAVVVLGALRNALRVVGKEIADCKVVVCGVGAAGSAIIRLLQSNGSGPGDVVAVDIEGIVHRDRPGLDDNLRWIADHTNAQGLTGSLADALVGADVFIGVSAPNLFGAEELQTMARDAIVFALANPDPEIDPAVATAHAAVVATGRSDYPNQINNVLAFPGVFRGLLDAQARDITDAMLLAAAHAIADVVTEPNPSFIVPSVFDVAVAPAVAEAVREATKRKDVAPV
jgi:malate dehydrogenase (oxaloacetate-decarboxylating)